jgi:UDP-glucose:(heptosyl)LPS alpha-1,3-glucosyltransferase
MRRIALITRRFDVEGGGTERDLIITANYLARHGHQLAVYALEPRGPIHQFDIHRVKVPAVGRSLRLFIFAYRAAALARRDGAEIVLSFARINDADILRSGGSAHSSFLKASRKWRNPLASALLPLSPYHRVQMVTERRGFRSPALKKVIAVSELVRQDLIESFALPPKKVATLYNGVDLNRFRPEARLTLIHEVRRELEIPADAPLVVFVGNGFARKGLRFLLEGWPQMPPSAHLLIAGTDRALTSYQRCATRLGVAHRVRFLGPSASIERVFAAADVLALPSLFEPFGNVALEAMAAGVPALCSAACGVAEILPPAIAEFTVRDPTNLNELASSLKGLLAASGDLRKPARETAERFTWDNYAMSLEELIAEL